MSNFNLTTSDLIFTNSDFIFTNIALNFTISASQGGNR